MLTLLRVKNFILMEDLELELEAGLNVLTGETGAGKSIVVGALGLVLGGRASADQVRPGASEAEIEALFDLGELDPQSSPSLRRLVESGVLAEEGARELIVRRVVQENGRSRAYLNGKLCTAGELAALAPDLADVASQHESVALTDPTTHLGHLDDFAKLGSRRAALGVRVAALEELCASIRALRDQDKSRGEREAFLAFMLQGIDDLAPQPGEIDELGAERKRLRHASKLLDLTQRAASRLDGEDGLCDQVARVASDLRVAAELDASLESIAKTLDGCYAELREAASTCERYAEEVGGDPGRLAEVEERLYRLEGLLRQHGPTIEDAIAARERLASELEALTSTESRLSERERELDERLPEAAAEARELSASRREAAEKLGAAIGAELGALGMGGARVLVEVEPLPTRGVEAVGEHLGVDGARLSRDGIDRVEFLISPNKGIEPKPLRKIASGGELSRALLALKRVLAEGGPAGLYVFDEVDSGVGGAVAERIGAAIADVARHHQVLCITHLAPIAAFADAHFVVTKTSHGDVTESRVERVQGDPRVREVARMLSGATITRAGEDAARELIAAARGAIAPAPGPTAKRSNGGAAAGATESAPLTATARDRGAAKGKAAKSGGGGTDKRPRR